MFESDALNEILQAELSRGNEVAEQSAWPPKCKNLVVLKRRFQQQYEAGDLSYRRINDKHYWYAEYSTSNNAECLACGF